jgi:hypothetical protein
VIQQQHQPPANWQANALEWVITEIGKDAIDKIHAHWVSMEIDQVSAE